MLALFNRDICFIGNLFKTTVKYIAHIIQQTTRYFCFFSVTVSFNQVTR